MTRRPTALVALITGAALALPLAGCGSEDERTIPHDQGSTLIRLLRDARDQGGDPDNCDALLRTVARLQAEVQTLPASVDGDTRRSVTDGVNNLADTARQECENVQTETTTTPTTETTPPPTTETTPPPTTETTPPPPTETTPPPTTPPDEGNGNGNGNGQGNGGTPPGQEKKAKKPKKDKPKKPKAENGKGHK